MESDPIYRGSSPFTPGFRRFVEACRKQGIQVALDFAIQCSPDHPWLKQHPEWFKRRPDGSIVGSRLIAQKFTKPEYFRPRPSGVGYNAASTGGTNYGPSNPDHLKAVQERLDAVMEDEGVTAHQVPSEMVTASGAGMDPHIPPAAADIQAARVAKVRRRS